MFSALQEEEKKFFLESLTASAQERWSTGTPRLPIDGDVLAAHSLCDFCGPIPTCGDIGVTPTACEVTGGSARDVRSLSLAAAVHIACGLPLVIRNRVTGWKCSEEWDVETLSFLKGIPFAPAPKARVIDFASPEADINDSGTGPGRDSGEGKRAPSSLYVNLQALKHPQVARLAGPVEGGVHFPLDAYVRWWRSRGSSANQENSNDGIGDAGCVNNDDQDAPQQENGEKARENGGKARENGVSTRTAVTTQTEDKHEIHNDSSNDSEKAQEAQGKSDGEDCDEEGNVPYLKDVHLALVFERLGLDSFYDTPGEFQPDWINGYFLRNGSELAGDDYRFVYVGPGGSATGWHADVAASHSWSANVRGTKRWWFARGGDGAVDFENGVFPLDEAGCFYVDQFPGDLLLVPSLVPHRVENLTDSISVNHNWGCPIAFPAVTRAVISDHSALARDLGTEVSGMDDEVESAARCQTGIGLCDLASMIWTAVERLSIIDSAAGSGGVQKLETRIEAGELFRCADKLWEYEPFARNAERWLPPLGVPLDLPQRARQLYTD